MIAYRAEIWCDGIPGQVCTQGIGEGIPHHDLPSMRNLATNQEAILLKQGWTKEGDKHFCPSCSRKRSAM